MTKLIDWSATTNQNTDESPALTLIAQIHLAPRRLQALLTAFLGQLFTPHRALGTADAISISALDGSELIAADRNKPRIAFVIPPLDMNAGATMRIGNANNNMSPDLPLWRAADVPIVAGDMVGDRGYLVSLARSDSDVSVYGWLVSGVVPDVSGSIAAETTAREVAFVAEIAARTTADALLRTDTQTAFTNQSAAVTAQLALKANKDATGISPVGWRDRLSVDQRDRRTRVTGVGDVAKTANTRMVSDVIAVAERAQATADAAAVEQFLGYEVITASNAHKEAMAGTVRALVQGAGGGGGGAHNGIVGSSGGSTRVTGRDGVVIATFYGAAGAGVIGAQPGVGQVGAAGGQSHSDSLGNGYSSAEGSVMVLAASFPIRVSIGSGGLEAVPNTDRATPGASGYVKITYYGAAP